MSEYQQYEFLAIDRPLTPDEQAAIRRLSSRVEPTATHARFVYHYGDFRGRPLEVLESYFDVMVYFANWGTRRLAFRFPRSVIDARRINQYAALEEVSLTTSDEYAILDINFSEEGGEWFGDDEDESDALAGLAPLRQDILRGDLRGLYLAWLKGAPNLAEWSDEEDDEELDEEDGGAAARLIEPPVPPGLRELSAPLHAFATFFRIDEDLIAAAAEASPPLGTTEEPVEEWVALLPAAERDAFLLRVARGEPHVGMELMRRLRELGSRHGGQPAVEEPAASRRSLATLLAAAEQHEQRRKEQQRKAAERARLKRLEDLAAREPEAWRQVSALIERMQATPYDEAVALLVELRELAAHRGQQARFSEQLDELVERYRTRSSLLGRMRKAGLLAGK